MSVHPASLLLASPVYCLHCYSTPLNSSRCSNLGCYVRLYMRDGVVYREGHVLAVQQLVQGPPGSICYHTVQCKHNVW